MVTDAEEPHRIARVRFERVVPSAPAIELAGLVTALLESGLAELPWVVPEVGTTSVSPGLAGWVDPEAVRWRATLRVRGTRDRGRADVDLCAPSGECSSHSASGLSSRANEWVAGLLEGLAARLGADFSLASARWEKPLSKDAYANFVIGRAAATLYGLRPPIPDAHVGDPRRDPFARATFLDPKIALAHWLRGRRDAAIGLVYGALSAHARALALDPERTLYLADYAAALQAGGKPEAAREEWASLASPSRDPRFVVSLARAALESRHPEEARPILDALPPRFRRTGAVVELRVRIADREGSLSDELLARWQETTVDPEPVRRRISTQLRARRFGDALVLLEALRARGREEEAANLEIAIATALGDHARAAEVAERIGRVEAARAVRVRAAIEADPRTIPPPLFGIVSPRAAIVRGEILLVQEKPREALREAAEAQRLHPWMPEALLLAARAHERQGNTAQAQAARREARAADPGPLGEAGE